MKTGITISSGGYRLIRTVGHPRATRSGHYVFEHTLIMERKIRRLLKKGEIVHHKNHNKLDNRIKNLELTTQSEHMKHHPPINPFKKGVIHSLSHRKKISISKKLWWAQRKESLPSHLWQNK